MTGPLVYVDRSRVREGSLDSLRPAMASLVDFVAEHEPDILTYHVYFSGDDELMTVIHMHRDQASLEFHLEMAGPKFPPIGKFIDLESIDVYGQITAELADRLREKASTLGDGRVTIHAVHTGTGSIPDGGPGNARS